MSRRLGWRALSALFLLASISSVQAEPTPSPSPTPRLYSPQTLAELKRLQQAALTSDYAYRQVAHLSNNIGPRLSGSAQAQKAVEYVASELKALGLEVQLEKVMVPHWVRGEETAELVQFPGQAADTAQKIVLTALGGSVTTPPEGLTAEVVVVRDFDELESLGKEKVRGKIVLFNHPFDKRMAAQGRGGEAYGEAVVYRGNAPSAAARLGGIAALVRSVGGEAYRLPHTGLTKYDDDAPKIPAAAVTEEDAKLIAALAPQGTVRMKLVLTPQQLPDAVSYNVIGDLKGSEQPEQVVIVSGHLDSWDLGTGAIDDGAGVAVAMEAANLVRQLKLQPRRTIRVVAWMNEENGVAGGKAYAAEHASEAANHFAAIETDGGAGHPLGIYFAGKPGLKQVLAPVAKVLEASGAGLLQAREGVGTDVDPLLPLGVPNFSPIQDSRFYFNYHHTAADTLDKIDPQELAENAAVNAVLAYALANLEQPLPR
ncbi:MAG: M20/M25/M40 family metallo-hydrolase [Spartobacteria bacterium]